MGILDNVTATQLTELYMRSHRRSNDILEKVNKLEYLSGLTIDELVILFAAGYMLEPPKPQKHDKLTELLKTGLMSKEQMKNIMEEIEE